MTKQEAQDLINKIDIAKDFKDFCDAFASYRGINSANLNNDQLVSWMNFVADELIRINKKLNWLIELNKSDEKD